MEFKAHRERYVDNFEDIIKIYEISTKLASTLINSEEDYKINKYISLNKITWIQDSLRYYKITTKQVKEEIEKDGSKSYIAYPNKWPCTFIFDKTGDVNRVISNLSIGKMSKRCYKPSEIADLFPKDEDGRIINSAKAILGFNPKYDSTEHNVVIYDLNSAYAGVLSNKIIDTYNYRMCDTVKENEVGFYLNHDLSMVHEGKFADFVFPLIDSPYKEYVKKWYEIKKNSPKGSLDRIKAKQVLVVTVGLMQKHNPFLRAYVINTCNEFIQHFLDKYKEDICMWNTDAIYSTKHIEELDNLVGDSIGQFKIEYEGLFRQKGLNYQKVDLKETTYRGVIKMSFNNNYNILKDPTPPTILPYRMNQESLKLELNTEL